MMPHSFAANASERCTCLPLMINDYDNPSPVGVADNSPPVHLRVRKPATRRVP